MPRAPVEQDDGDGGRRHGYEVPTGDDHMVAEWANMTILQVGELPLFDYLRFRRDAFIYQMDSTEKGRAYLNDAWTFEQVEPDRQAARELFG